MVKKIKTAVILAGGLGTRIAEETHLKPKPMIEIGGMPILWHIMKIYSSFGVDNFIICGGYKCHVIKDYFINYKAYRSDLTISLASGVIETHNCDVERWKVTILDTGLETMTGGRLRRASNHLSDVGTFFFTYGDGVADVDLNELEKFHFKTGLMATVTATSPPGRFGIMTRHRDKITSFKEKPSEGDALVNAGFFVLSTDVLELIEGDSTVWENSPLETLASMGELACYHHTGFWQPMDTLRDKNKLDQLWNQGAPWKCW